MDPLDAVIRPIVEGQIRSYMHDHPGSISEAFPGQAVGGIAKRITHDLLAQRGRIAAALGARLGAADDGGT